MHAYHDSVSYLYVMKMLKIWIISEAVKTSIYMILEYVIYLRKML
jgi:hypothetical protein